MPEGWPIFAEWERLKALPWYGGNNIPEAYLDRHNAKVSVIIHKRELMPQVKPDMPSSLAKFVGDL